MQKLVTVMRRNNTFLCVGAGIFAAGLVLFALYPREPVYHGKRLSVWFAELYGPEPNLVAEQAIKRLGSNAVPFVVGELNANDSRLRKTYSKILDRLPDGIAGHLPSPIPAFARQNLAAAVLINLGPDARAAIPDLILALHSADPNIRANAAIALSIAASLPEAKGVVPHLIATMKDPERQVRYGAVFGLDSMGSEALLGAKSALISALEDKDSSVVAGAANALGKLGTNALDAVPALIEITRLSTNSPLNPSDTILRRLTLRALKRIEPGVAAKAD